MEVSYNLRYQKTSFSNKILLDKEGEIIIYSKGFRLKGKGASDKGELINFSEIKEFYYRNNKIFFITFTKEKYVLLEAGTLFDQLLIDLYKARNEFLLDALFMKGGKLKAEFEGDFQRLSKFGRLINKGTAKFKLYERSIVTVPPDQDAFAIHYDFVNFHEFDEDEYTLKVVLDEGTTIIFSKLGNDFDLFHEKINDLLGGMYEKIVNDALKEIFPYFHAMTLLKLAYKMKGGKAVSLKDIQKIDKELADAVDEFIFEDKKFAEKTKLLRDLTDEYGVFYAIAKDEAVKGSFIKWTMFTIPSKNVVAFSILPRWQEGGIENEENDLSTHDTYFFKIIMEQGNPTEKVEDKIREIDQALVILNFVKDPCYKDKRELRHSPYQYAIRKLPFLRILRKSYVGKASSPDVKDWQAQVKDVFKKASLK
ncbi:hypothetical protein GF366_02280 [Candidatus Peregrinibacteria bacterium]|nr:hypothetical protein [Candidatus Peregrinibacteria bacterium]